MYDQDYVNRFRRKVGSEASTSAQIGDIIAQSLSKIEVLLEDATTAIPVAFINKDKESGNEAIMYTYEKDGVNVANYVTALDRIYLVYKEIKNVKREQYIRAFRLAECNVSFDFKGTTIKAVFIGSGRSKYSEEEGLLDNFGVTSTAEGYMILPSSIAATLSLGVNTPIMIENKGWKITVEDSITNKGISYFALEEYFIADMDKTSENEVDQIVPPVENPASEILAGITQVFETETGYFKVDKKIQILERTATSVKFIIPFGINDINIEVKKNGEIVSEYYKVRG